MRANEWLVAGMRARLDREVFGPQGTPKQVPQGTHNHCKADTCYNRIQFVDTCSRCGGPTTPCRGKEDGCP